MKAPITFPDVYSQITSAFTSIRETEIKQRQDTLITGYSSLR